MDSDKLKYGIVFCGGGAKGAYQIGVWKRLRELGLDKEIVGVSGASIGAMNSMLFAQGDYDAAEEVWKQVKENDMMPLNLSKSTVMTALKCLLPYAVASGVASALTTSTTALLMTNPYLSVAAAISAGSRLSPLIAAGAVGSGILGAKELFPKLGLFSREKLGTIIQDSIDPTGISTTNKQVYTALTALSWPHLPDKSVAVTDSASPILKPIGQIEYRSWKHLTYTEIVETVLASAALPGAYPASAHKGRVYVDGGVLDNAPVKPLIDSCFRNIIIIHLEYLKKAEERHQKERMIRSQGDSTIRFLHIWPSSPSIGDTLQIDSSLTRFRINMGYEDAQRQLDKQLNELRHQVINHLQSMEEKARLEQKMKDAARHYDLANEIYKKEIRSAVQMRNVELFRAFLQTKEGQTMLRNYEYAADLGHEQAKKMIAQIHKLQKKAGN